MEGSRYVIGSGNLLMYFLLCAYNKPHIIRLINMFLLCFLYFRMMLACSGRTLWKLNGRKGKSALTKPGIPLSE